MRSERRGALGPHERTELAGAQGSPAIQARYDDNTVSSGPSARSRLISIAHRTMVERGLEPDLPPAAQADAAKLTDAQAADLSLQDLARPALGFDRQRRLARPRSAHGRRADRGRRDARSWWPSPTSTRWCAQGSARSTTTHALNTTSVYTAARDLSHAAGAAVDRSDLARRGRGAAGGRDRDRRWPTTARVRGVDGVSRARVATSAKLAYNARRRMARRQRRRARRAGAVPGSMSNSGSRIGPRRRCASAGTSRARSTLETLEARPVFDGDALVGPASPTRRTREGADRGLHDRRQRRDG